MIRVSDGTPCWAEAHLPDLDAGKRFYSRLFGWSFPAEAVNGRLPAYLADQRVAGLTELPGGRGQGTWVVYFAARDTAGTAARISAMGGRMPPGQGPAAGPDGGFTAEDPAGAVFGVRQADARGFTATGRPGMYCWTEVYTREKKDIDPFYREVFSFTEKQVEDGTGSDLAAWALNGTGVASRVQLGRHFPEELHGHVLACFAVEDCDRTVEELLALGGTVTVAPRESRFGRFAITADDQGARLAVVDLETRLPPASSVDDKPIT